MAKLLSDHDKQESGERDHDESGAQKVSGRLLQIIEEGIHGVTPLS